MAYSKHSICIGHCEQSALAVVITDSRVLRSVKSSGKNSSGMLWQGISSAVLRAAWNSMRGSGSCRLLRIYLS